MKKLFIFLIILFLFTSTYATAAPNNQGPNNEANTSPNNLTNSNNNVTPTQNANQLNVQEQTSNKGNTSNIQVQQQTQINQNEGNVSKIPQTVQNQNQIAYSNTEQQVRSVIQQKTQEVNSSMGNSLQNQKMAQVAVQTMETSASMFGKSEADISRISNEIKNSLEVTTRAEEQIKNRSEFVKFIVGGDNESAGLISQQTVRNEERLRELNRLILESDFNNQTKAILQEQVQNIEQEQLRLKTLAEQEMHNKGILGWIWK